MNQNEATHGEEEKTGSATGGPTQEQSSCSPDPKGGHNLDARGLTDPTSKNDRNRDSSGEAREDVGYVYLVGVLDGCHKIGRSFDPQGRLSQFAPLLPGRLEIVHQIITANPSWLESVLHVAFSNVRSGGEWFRIDSKHLELLKSMSVVTDAASLPTAILVMYLERSKPIDAGAKAEQQIRPPRYSSVRQRMTSNKPATKTVSTLDSEIRRLRESLGLSQAELAEKIGVNQSFVSKLERGESARLGADVLFALCDALNVTCQHFREHLPASGRPPAAPATPKRRKRG